MLQNLDIAAGRRRSPRWTLLRRRSGVPDEVDGALETIGLADLVDIARGHPRARAEAVARDRDAAGAGREAALLDEPVAGMSAEDARRPGRLLQRIGEERTVVVVEHDMDFMRAFATSVTVLHAGKVLVGGDGGEGAGRPEGAGGLPRAAGASSEDERRRQCSARRSPDAAARSTSQVGYGRTAVIHGVDVEVPADGVAAVMGHNGAGKTTLLRAAVGLLPVRGGADPARRRGRHRAAPRTSGCAAAWPTSRRASSRSGS